jgi:hypothetical protein
VIAVHFYMDESGTFTPTAGVSVVGVLAIPSKIVRATKRELTALTTNWPKIKGELKSASITAIQLTQLIDILFEKQVLLYGVVLDVSRESASDIAHHKSEQCEGVTRSITPQHQPLVVKHLWELRRTLEAMPIQLYIQSVAMRELVCTALAEAAMYFAQRRPKEIAAFHWVIDAKDPTKISTQEKWWKDTFAPLVETRSERAPFQLVDDAAFQYKHMKHKFRLAKTLWRPDGMSKQMVGLDIKAMVTENVSFVDSRDDILVQTADILTGFIRRICAGTQTDHTVLHQIGRLQIRRRHGTSINFITMSNTIPDLNHLKDHVKVMKRAARSMLIEHDR